MSNPCINRWGMNTFWYNFWYSDNNYASNLHQDTIFIKLINIYLFNGISLPHNIFANFYWYAKHTSKLDFPTYYRWFTLRRTFVDIQATYSLRHQTDCVFPMKLWILKYGNWLIINLYWFRPLTLKSRGAKRLDQTHKDTFHVDKYERFSNVRKLKTLFSSTLFNHMVMKSYYRF